MAFSLETIKTRVSNRLKDISDINNATLFQMATDLNQFLYNEMFGEDPWRFIDDDTEYTVTSSPSTQALPADYRDNTEYGCGFYVKDSNGNLTTTQLKPTGPGSNDFGYYLDGTNVIFTGINSSTTIVLRYIPTLADITALSDTFVVPDENKELVQEGMVLYYYRYEEDPREADQDLRFTRLLGLFKEGLPKSPKVFSVPSQLERNSVYVRNDIPVYPV